MKLRAAAESLMKLAIQRLPGLTRKLRTRLWFLFKLGYWPRIDRPRTFNEWIQWRKFHDRRPLFRTLCDKLGVRAYVAERVGERHLAAIHQEAGSFAGLDWAALPPSFVLKANHGSGEVLVVREKPRLDPREVEDQVAAWLAHDYADLPHKNEWGYSGFKRKVFAEEYLGSEAQPVPADFKFYVFAGSVEMIHVDAGRGGQHTRTFYSPAWERLEIRRIKPTAPAVPPPTHLTQMIEIARRLGEGLDFVRVDMYDFVDREPVVGEMTLYPASGFGRFTPQSEDERLGRLWASARKS
jgi:hypothetical protein